jgi:effector-binding domain-containing protein
MKNLVPIGRFSQVTRLSIKALRLYDETDLLRPALVDPDSGYRYYSLAQASEAEAIRLLRSLGMPLPEIREVLRQRRPDDVSAVLDRYRAHLEERMAEEQRILAFLQRLISQEEGIMSYEIRVKELAAQPILSIRSRAPMEQLGPLIAQALGEIFGYMGAMLANPAGPVIWMLHQNDGDQGADFETCVPVAERLAGSGRIAMGEIAAGPVAYTLHRGPYEEMGPAYAALAQWVQEHGHEVAGPMRELYLVSPGDTKDPVEYRTEIQQPIR